ncbi:MAG TPA: CAP domain-containing protein [Candidatus Saccharimonadales bacterium]
MTLVTRNKPAAYHKKISGQHHRSHSKSYRKPYWPYLPLIAIVVAGVLLNSAWPFGKHSVLGYATDMTVQSLFSDTNDQRVDNGLAGLGLNAELDTAAQNKANDMAARDYWSHDTPDGKTPWSFITAAGYNYQTAGENLAYGFATAADTITGWMNSPEHRANILNTTYKEVGFGIANSADYQNSGPETIVVAMYAEPAGATVATTAPSSPANNYAPAASPTPVSSTPPVQNTNTAPVTKQNAAAQATPSTTQKSIPPSQIEPAQQRVSRIQILTAGDASWSMFVTSLIIAAGLLIFLMRHGLAWHKVLRRGERFVLHHQLLDCIIIATITIGFILTRTSGIIR